MTPPRPSLQDELLADLRVAAPIPVVQPVAGQPATPVEETPTVALRLTPWRWSRPSVRSRGEKRLELSAGPVRISVTGFDR